MLQQPSPKVAAPWESMERPLARLRQAIAEADICLADVRRAYASLSELGRSPVLLDSAANELSCQERRVAFLVAAGKSNEEVAAILHVSVNTVKSQVRSILQKLDLRSRWQVREALGIPQKAGPPDRRPGL